MKRVITGSVGILILIPVCMFSHTVIWPLLLSLFALIATEEILTCTGHRNNLFRVIPAWLFSFLPLICYYLCRVWHVMDFYRCVFLFSALFFFTAQVLSVFEKNREKSDRLYSYIAFVYYVVLSFTAIFQVRYLDNGQEEGKHLFLLIFLGAWVSDTFAYLVGMLIGKHSLAPEISAKKTIEGSIGGIVGNMIFFAGYALILRARYNINANVVLFVVLGALFSVVGQVGDLIASCIKRHCAIKDYGNFFPGHGGVLDRFDSTLSIACVMMIVDAAFGASFSILS